MKRENFCYWLQGHFELQDHFNEESRADPAKNQFLTPGQVKCVKSHVQLHLECSQRNNEEPGPFISWLDGALIHFEHLPSEKQEALVLEMRKRLNSIFVHVIDPAMPGDKPSLQAIHDGKIKAGEKLPKDPKSKDPPKRKPRGGLDRRGPGGTPTRYMC